MNQYTTYHIYRETKTHVTGDPADESESSTQDTQLVIVPESEKANYNEALVSEYESQDYSFQFDHKLLCTITGAELAQLTKTLNEISREVVQ